MYVAHFILCVVHCAFLIMCFRILCMVSNVHSTFEIVHCALYISDIVHGAFHIVYIVHCALSNIVHCACGNCAIVYVLCALCMLQSPKKISHAQ